MPTTTYIQTFVIQINKMYTKIRTFRTTDEQHKTLNKMKSYNIDVSRFIRDAIREKIKRDQAQFETEKSIPLSQSQKIALQIEKILKEND